MAGQDDVVFARAQELYRKGSFSESFHLFEELANRGRVGCQRFVGWMYFCGEGVPTDLSKAYDWFTKAAQHGDREAKFGAGSVCLKNGDNAAALKWFSDGCGVDFAPACFRLGWMYQAGHGVNADPNRAYELLSKAYSLGHLPAGRLRALMLIKGHRGVFGRAWGPFLLAKVVVLVVSTAVRDRNSQRLMV